MYSGIPDIAENAYAYGAETSSAASSASVQATTMATASSTSLIYTSPPPTSSNPYALSTPPPSQTTSYGSAQLVPTATTTIVEIIYDPYGSPNASITHVYTEYGAMSNYTGVLSSVSTAITAVASTSAVAISASGPASVSNATSIHDDSPSEGPKPISIASIVGIAMGIFLLILGILLVLFLRYRRRNLRRLRELEEANRSGTTLVLEKTARPGGGGFSSSPPIHHGRFSRLLSTTGRGRRLLSTSADEDYYSPTSPASATPLSPFSASGHGYGFVDDIATGTGLGSTRGRATGLPTLSDVRDSVVLGRTRSIGSSRPSGEYAVTPYVLPTPTGSTTTTAATGSSRQRFRTGSVTTYGETDDDEDAIAVDGSSLARTLTTESSRTIQTESTETGEGSRRRGSSPVAWGSGPSREPSAATRTGSYLTSFGHASGSSQTSPTTPGAGLTYMSLHSQNTRNPFSDPSHTFMSAPQSSRPYPVRQGSVESDSMVSLVSNRTGAARTEASYRTGDDAGSEVLPLGGGWTARGEAPPAYTPTPTW